MINDLIGNFGYSTPSSDSTAFWRSAPNQVRPAGAGGPGYASNSIKDSVHEHMVKDLNTGTLQPEVQQLVDAVLFPGKQGIPKVEVSHLRAKGITAKDAIVIQRVPSESKKPNVVLFIPHPRAPSFQAFNSVAEANTWLKKLADDPAPLNGRTLDASDGASQSRRKRETNQQEYPATVEEIVSTPAEVVDVTPSRIETGKSNSAAPGDKIDQSAQTIVDLVDQMEEQYPTPQKVVSEQVRKDIKAFTKQFGPSEIDIDPDKIFVQHFSEDDTDYKKHGFNPKGYVIGDRKPTSPPKSLTQAIADNDPWLDDRVIGGQTVIFSGDPDNPIYDPAKKIDIDPGLLPAIARNRDMAQLYGTAQQKFWQENMETMQALHEKNYMFRAGLDAANGLLSKDGLAMVVEAAEFETPGKSDTEHVERSMLEINNYRATDITVLKHKETGRIVVYMPGDGQSFFEFKDEAAMRQWVYDVAKSEEGRAELERHFTDYYLRDGPIRKGVSSTLKNIGANTKTYLPGVVGYGRPDSRIEGNMFENLTKLQSWDAISDGDEWIKSNRKILLSRISQIAGAVGVVIPPAVFLTAPIQIFIGAWQANNGHTEAERNAGLVEAGFAVGDVALSALPTKWVGKLLKPLAKRGSRLIKGLGNSKGRYSIGRRAPNTNGPHGVEGTYTPKPNGKEPIAVTAPVPKEKPVAYPGIKGTVPVEEISAQKGKLVKLGGTMDSLTEVDDGLLTFVDLNKKDSKVRLNIMAHGEEPGGLSLRTNTKTPAKVWYDGKAHTPQELLDTLKAKGIKPSDYDNVRLLMCYSANGEQASFAAEFSRLIGKPVKGYEGTLSAYIAPETISELKTKAIKYTFNKVGGEDELLPLERRLVDRTSMQYVSGKFASKTFNVAKKNPHYNPIKAWTFTYRPVTFSPTP